jgi:hypothetical protein
MDKRHWISLIIIALLTMCLSTLLRTHRDSTTLEDECRKIGGDLWCVDNYGNRFSDLLQIAPPVAGSVSSPPKLPPPGVP